MKKILALIMSAIMLFGLVACSAEPSPETYIAGEWECISIIANNRELCFTDDFYMMTVNRDGTAVFNQDDNVAEYTWVFESKGEKNNIYTYIAGGDELTARLYHNTTKETMLMCEYQGDKTNAAVFRKTGTDILIEEDTTYNTLLGVPFSDLGLEYLENGWAYDMVAGSWRGTTLMQGDETTSLWPGTLSMELVDNTYSITMLGEERHGNMKYMGDLEDMPTYAMDGDYESVLLVYDETTGMVVLYDEVSEIGMRFVPA